MERKEANAEGSYRPGITDPTEIRRRTDKYKKEKTIAAKLRYMQTQIDKLRQPFVGKTVPDLAKTFVDSGAEGHEVLMKAIQDLRAELQPLRDIRSKNLKAEGLTYDDKKADDMTGFGTLMSLDAKKMKLAEKDVPAELNKLHTELKNGGIDVSKSVLRDLVVLDDWSAIWHIAKPFVMKYGLPALAHVYKSYVKPTINRWLGNDEGFNPIDFGSGLDPQKVRYEPGFNKEIPGVVLPKMASNSSVSPHYIKTLMSPETMCHRMTTKNPTKTALSTAVKEITISCNANGAAGVHIFASQPYSTGTVMINNADSFSVNSGSQSAGSTASAGPFFSLSGAVNKARLVSCSVQVIPIISNNSPGSVQFAYWQSKDVDWIGAPSVIYNTSSSDMITAPWYVSGNARSTYRMVSLPADQEGTLLSAINTSLPEESTNDYFYILATGFTPSTSIMKLVITFVMDFIPNSSYIPITPMAYSQSGPASMEFASTIFAAHPILQCLTLNDAKAIVNQLPDDTCEYGVLANLLEESAKAIKPQETGYTLPYALPMMEGNESTDFVGLN